MDKYYLYQCPACGSMEMKKDRSDNVMTAGALCFLLGFLGFFFGPSLAAIGLILAIVLPFTMEPKLRCRICKRRWDIETVEAVYFRMKSKDVQKNTAIRRRLIQL